MKKHPTLLICTLCTLLFASCNTEKTAPTSTSTEQENITLSIEGMTCNSCVQSITRTINKINGVQSCEVSLNEKKAQISHTKGAINPQDAIQQINKLGFKATLL